MNKGVWARKDDSLRDVIEKQGSQLYKYSNEIKRLHKVVNKLELESERLRKEVSQYKKEVFIGNGGRHNA